MPCLRTLRRAAILAVATTAMGAPSALANTNLYVGKSGSDTANTCQTQTSPCLTVTHAITESELVGNVATINVAAGTYAQDLALTFADSGITIAGAGSSSTIIQGDATSDTVMGGSASSFTLENLEVYNPPTNVLANGVDGTAADTDITLDNVAIVNDAGGHAAGISEGSGQVTMNGGSITTGNATAQVDGISSASGDTTLNGVGISVEGTGAGIDVAGPLSVSGGAITQANSTASNQAILSSSGAPLTLATTTLTDAGLGATLSAQGALSISATSVSQTNPSAATQAITDPGAYAPIAISSSQVSDAGAGIPISVVGPLTLARSSVKAAGAAGALSSANSTTISDSTISDSSPSATAPVLSLSNDGADLVQRTSVKGQTLAQPAITAHNVNLALNSSLILGGQGVSFPVDGTTTHQLSVSGSTIDAGTLGVRDSGYSSISAASSSNSAAYVTVGASILIEPPAASQSGTTVIDCDNTEVPPTTQTTNGTIDCPSSAGDSFTQSLNSVFANPGTDYTPNPLWGGVDSVPADSTTPSSTDLLGNPRVVNGVGACNPGLQDKGAIELTGHGGVEPALQIVAPSAPLVGKSQSFSAGAPNDPDATLTYDWTFSDGASAIGASVQHTFNGAGTASARVIASGAGACSGSASSTFTIAAPPPPAQLDVITGLKLAPSTFKDLSSGNTPITTKTSGGTVISYNGTQSATSTFTVQFATTGRRSGASCVSATSKNKHAKKCTLYTSIKSFTHVDTGGANSFRFSGRFSNGKLAVAGYRLEALPRNAAGTGKAVYATFHVKS